MRNCSGKKTPSLVRAGDNKLLCWTDLGTVDYQKTAEKLIRHKKLDTVKQYKLACLYCLEDYIPALWEKLPEEDKTYFYKAEESSQVTEPELEFCWPYILKGEGNKLDNMPGRPSGNPTTFNQYAFEYSASEGNKAASEYFFRKLTNDEREDSLFEAAQTLVIERSEDFESFPDSKLSDTFCYLLSLMSPGQQVKFFQKQPYEVLMCLLDWPWQDLFMVVAERIWNFLSAFDYVKLLQDISKRAQLFHVRTELFQEFFLRGSCDFRNHFVDELCRNGVSFKACFDYQYSETIKVVLRNVDSAHKKRLVSCESFLSIFCRSVLNGKRHLVELLLREATLSEEDKAGVKEDFRGYLAVAQRRRQTADWSINKLLEQFCHILDESKENAPRKTNSDAEKLY
ncbi:hypothetical protein AVEN_45852-1 [Araneus ventricosus]|uniref:Uncharacterized protein n=1 Tax=Araneus ventricosus TaxID=182803 RepID=A0A4Y2JTY8_ARAVE|nr:hypothetical protein AVEN_45852-1 [Araneus ventricosus]